MPTLRLLCQAAVTKASEGERAEEPPRERRSMNMREQAELLRTVLLKSGFQISDFTFPMNMFLFRNGGAQNVWI